MSTSKDRRCSPAVLARVLRIHELLKNGKHFTASSLGAQLEVASRTIQRDIEFMRVQFGAVIPWESTTNCYHYEKPCDALPFVRLDTDEAFALVVVGHTFAAWRGSALGRALTRALGKIGTVIGGAVSVPAAETLQELTSMLPAPDPAQVDAESRWFVTLLDAIRLRRVMRVDYRKPGAGEAETRILHPLHLTFIEGQWMLVAFDQGRGLVQNYVLMRIGSAEATGETFERPARFDVRTYLRGNIGRFTGREEHEVRLAFDAIAAPYVRERPWHPSQRIRELPDGAIEVTLTLNNLVDIERRVLASGVHVEVLAPSCLRDSLYEKVAALAQRYSPRAAEPGETKDAYARAG